MPEKAKASRIDALLDKGETVDMPECDAAHILGYLFEMIGADGPISNQEMLAWQEVTGIHLEPWETRFIRRLSGEYQAEAQRAVDPKRQAPWDGSAHVKTYVSDSLKESIKDLAKL